MNPGSLRKKLILESMVFVALVFVFSIGAYLLSMWSDDYEQDNDRLQGEVNNIAVETAGLRSKYAKVQNNTPFYDLVMQKNANDELSINRRTVRNRFDEFKTKYFLSNLHLTMSPVQEATGSGKYKGISNVVVTSEVNVTFEALNDEDVYSLLQAIGEDLSGVTRITKFSLKRNNRVSDAGLRTIAKTGQFPMVDGSIKFLWYGLKPLDSAINASKTATSTGSGGR